MRVLLVHPEDSPMAGEWRGIRWDFVLDLGWAGTGQYADWTQRLGCRTRGLYSYGSWHDDVFRIHEVIRAGGVCLVDAEGIDWWELLVPTVFPRIYEFLLLLKIAGEIGPSAEVHVTRPHPLADTLGRLLHADVVSFAQPSSPVSIAAGRYTKALRTLTAGQVVGIALDKWDTDYGLRRLFHRSPNSSNREQRVLLPSAYRNVSRVLTAYANVLPDRSFLLVTTRADGVIPDIPRNVSITPLASYARVPRNKSTELEISTLTERWRVLRMRLRQSNDPIAAHVVDLLASFERALRVGLRIRDTWREVLDRERISAVLCGDENNPYTRLPVLLAKSRGIHTVHCSHGALDVNLLLRGVCSDTYLARCEMEKDYMATECGVPVERIALGAPHGAHFRAREKSRAPGDQIVFFSEPYELYAGRTETLYGEVLPSLCAIARQCGRKVVLKLHPFESAKARSRLIDQILTGEDRQLVEISTAPISEQLLGRVWFGLGVESSVAVECALAGIPFFLCGWFDLGLHCYGRQYEKFGAARIVGTPSAILHIPELLGLYSSGADSRNVGYQGIEKMELDDILRFTPDVASDSRSPRLGDGVPR